MCIVSGRCHPRPARRASTGAVRARAFCIGSTGSGRQPERGAPYQLRGLFYEACDCFTVCPCWLGNDPDGGACTGVFAWEIEEGSIDGVDVAGLLAVSVSHHTGLRDEATPTGHDLCRRPCHQGQADALAAAFSGRLGGPLQELAIFSGSCLALSALRSSFVVKADSQR